MTELGDDFEYAEPATLLGRLQRGRGSGAVRALSEPGAGDLVYECVIRDPRWDHQVDSRDHYLASLIHRLDLPVDPIADHLLGGTAHADVRDVGLSLQVLGCLVELGRTDAAPVLRQYDDFAAEGLDDCEESVQEAACSAARMNGMSARPRRQKKAVAVRLASLTRWASGHLVPDGRPARGWKDHASPAARQEAQRDSADTR